MVGTPRHGLPAFLTHLGTYASASDIGELATRGGHSRRTLQRWLHLPGITFYPNVRYTALGLVHLHAFVPEPNERHLRFPYAGDAAWITTEPGMRSLYLHCLVPAAHLAQVQDALQHLAPCTIIATGDGWQDNDLTDGARTNMAPLPRLTDATPVVLAQAYPLVVPVATELLGRRLTMHDLWSVLYERMGERVWSYLPRMRRWRRNGATYVREAFTLLNRYGLVQQHVVRLEQAHTIELFLLTRSLEALEPLRAHAPLLEYFPGPDIFVVRLQGGIGLLKAILECDAVQAWWFVRPETVRRPRVQIERIFDPQANWTPCVRQE